MFVLGLVLSSLVIVVCICVLWKLSVSSVFIVLWFVVLLICVGCLLFVVLLVVVVRCLGILLFSFSVRCLVVFLFMLFMFESSFMLLLMSFVVRVDIGMVESSVSFSLGFIFDILVSRLKSLRWLVLGKLNSSWVFLCMMKWVENLVVLLGLSWVSIFVGYCIL